MENNMNLQVKKWEKEGTHLRQLMHAEALRQFEAPRRLLHHLRGTIFNHGPTSV
jgi:hypothetical protein